MEERSKLCGVEPFVLKPTVGPGEAEVTQPELGVDPSTLHAKPGGKKRLDADGLEDELLKLRPDSSNGGADGGQKGNGSATSATDLGGLLAVDGPQRVVGKEGLEKRLGDEGVDPLEDALGDDDLGHNSLSLIHI